MLSRWICFFSINITFVSMQVFSEPLSLNVKAESAILINADTGAVLFEKNAQTLRYPASTTKVATALYALKQIGDKLDTIVTADQESLVSISEEARRRSNFTVPSYWLVPGASHIGIKKGEQLSLRVLLYGLLLASGDDASNVIAQHIGKTIPDFVASMNAYMKEIGCQNTTFYNPHGLFHPKQQTTASDMALIMREALKSPIFREIIATVRYQRPKTNKQEATTFLQTNKLMRKGKLYYPKAIGGKTGYISFAKHCLVAAAKDGDRTLIAVLLKSKDREDVFLDATALFEAAFNQPKVKRTLLKAGPQKFVHNIPGAATPLATYTKNDISIEYYPAEEPKVKCLLYWDVDMPTVVKGQRVGELRLQTVDGKVLQVVPLLAQEDISPTWTWSMRHLFG